MPMLDRLLAILALWGLRGALAWFIAHQYTTIAVDKLGTVTRALGKL